MRIYERWMTRANFLGRDQGRRSRTIHRGAVAAVLKGALSWWLRQSFEVGGLKGKGNGRVLCRRVRAAKTHACAIRGSWFGPPSRQRGSVPTALAEPPRSRRDVRLLYTALLSTATRRSPPLALAPNAAAATPARRAVPHRPALAIDECRGGESALGRRRAAAGKSQAAAAASGGARRRTRAPPQRADATDAAAAAGACRRSRLRAPTSLPASKAGEERRRRRRRQRRRALLFISSPAHSNAATPPATRRPPPRCRRRGVPRHRLRARQKGGDAFALVRLIPRHQEGVECRHSRSLHSACQTISCYSSGRSERQTFVGKGLAVLFCVHQTISNRLPFSLPPHKQPSPPEGN